MAPSHSSSATIVRAARARVESLLMDSVRDGSESGVSTAATMAGAAADEKTGSAGHEVASAATAGAASAQAGGATGAGASGAEGSGGAAKMLFGSMRDSAVSGSASHKPLIAGSASNR